MENAVKQMDKITSVRFEGKGQVDIIATFEDGEERKLITYFDDEISFTESELVGLTCDEAWELHVKKDQAYLLS